MNFGVQKGLPNTMAICSSPAPASKQLRNTCLPLAGLINTKENSVPALNDSLLQK